MEGDSAGTERPLDKARTAVDRVQYFRDHYFEEHSLSDADKKDSDLEIEIQKTTDMLNTLQGDIKNKAQFNALKGRLLNLGPNFIPEARDLLSKAVKLDPTLYEAWNDLGGCFWKNKEINSAYDCFTGANGHVKNKVSLRNLSMVMRQLRGTAQERAQKVADSVDVAKNSVQMDIKDGESWLVLGNAYLSLFFVQQQNPQTLKQCMSAYAQAERDPISNCSPDLHYNRSVAYNYQEEYQLALIGLQRAIALDPTWEEPKVKLKELIDYLEAVGDQIKTKGRQKPKKLKAFVESLTDVHLGPYKGGSFTSAKGSSITLNPVLLSDLTPGFNTERVVLGKVVSVVSSVPVPYTFCMVGIEETCISVTVYNLAAGTGPRIGDTVAVPEPFIQNVNVEYQEMKVSYRSIRVDSPLVLVVNGKKMTSDKHSATTFSSTFITH